MFLNFIIILQINNVFQLHIGLCHFWVIFWPVWERNWGARCKYFLLGTCFDQHRVIKKMTKVLFKRWPTTSKYTPHWGPGTLVYLLIVWSSKSPPVVLASARLQTTTPPSPNVAKYSVQQGWGPAAGSGRPQLSPSCFHLGWWLEPLKKVNINYLGTNTKMT